MSTLIKALREMYNLLARYGMEATFMVMLLAARSKRHLRALHDAQPENCRLLRQEYLVLEDAWDQLYPNGYASGADAQIIACILDALRYVDEKYVGRGNLTSYYLDRFCRDQEDVAVLVGPGIVLVGPGIEHIIFTCPQRKGHGDAHFTTTLFGQESQVGFLLSIDKQYIMVRFTMWEYDLTEPLVHTLLTKLPKFQLSRRNYYSNTGGYQVGICYILKREVLQEYILLHDGEGEGVTVGGSCYLAQEGFIPEALRQLIALGVPIEQINPIMVAEHRS